MSNNYFQFHCESSVIDDENIVSVILRDKKNFALGESYRYCLVLLQTKNLTRDLVVGCSNITKLKSNGSGPTSDNENQRVKNHLLLNQSKPHEIQANENLPDATANESRRAVSDIATFDKITSKTDDFWYKNREPHVFDSDLHTDEGYAKESSTFKTTPPETHNDVVKVAEEPYAYQLMSSLSDSFLPGLGIGFLVASVFVFIWGATKMKNERGSSPPVTTCYAASDHTGDIIDCENGNRYLKLQATTTL